MLSTWFELPDNDPAVPALQRLTRESVIRMLKVSGLVPDDGQADQMIALDAAYEPGVSVRAAFAWLPDTSIPEERVWVEGQVFYLRGPVREPMSRRGQLAELDGEAVELYAFPNDRRLRDLRRVTKNAALGELWASWFGEEVDVRRTFLRYVPESKFVCRVRPVDKSMVDEVRAEGVALRVVRAKTAKHMIECHRALADQGNQAGGTLHIPPVLAADEASGLIAIPWLGGVSLDDKLRRTDPKRVMRRLVDAVQTFHRIRIDGLEPFDPITACDQTTVYLDELATALPTYRDQLRDIKSAFINFRNLPAYPDPVTLHNDLNWSQLQIRNSRYTLLDFECMVAGDPLIDIAHMDLYLELASARRDFAITEAESTEWRGLWLSEWNERLPGRLSEDAYRYYRTASAIRVARGMIRHLRPVWRDALPNLIRIASDALLGDRTAGGRR